jgi:ATP-dependent Clp protease ATP-binding subunit ClpA
MQPPELINRITEVVPFSRLQKSNMAEITKIGLNDIARRLENGHNMGFECSDLAIQSLSERGFDLRYGARPLKRVLTKELLNPISMMILDGGVKEGETVRVMTRGEAENLTADYICGDKISSDRNNIAIIRNHTQLEKIAHHGTN